MKTISNLLIKINLEVIEGKTTDDENGFGSTGKRNYHL